jgi:phosphoribosylanthranilate isomerase
VTVIKICGLLEVEHALVAAKAGADYVGLVFAEGKHKITPEKALEIVKAVKALEHSPQAVGVFAGFPAAEVNRIAAYCSLDRVQLSGNEDLDYCISIEKPITEVFHVTTGTRADQLIAVMSEGLKILKDRDVIFMLDTKVGDASGGTGKTFDWSVAGEVARRFPIIVAGGLNPDNVGDLLRQAHPWGVDVSSGVETGGRKDLTKIRGFIEVVRKYDAQGGSQ